jgi:hypothetical protein
MSQISDEMRKLVRGFEFAVKARSCAENTQQQYDVAKMLLEDAIADLEKDARLGNAVRGMESGERLDRTKTCWWFTKGGVCHCLNTPEAALGIEEVPIKPPATYEGEAFHERVTEVAEILNKRGKGR